MNAITRSVPNGLAGARALPVLSKGLARAVSALSEPRTDLVLAAPRWSEAEADEARGVLAAYEERCQPAPERVIDLWLMALLAARLKNPPTGRDLGAFSGAVFRALGDLPAEAWSNDTLVAASRSFEWWPGTGELDKFLRPIGRRAIAERDALRKIAARPDASQMAQAAAEPELSKAEFAAELLRKYGYKMQGYDPKPEPRAPEGPPACEAPLPPLSPRMTLSVGQHRAELRAVYVKQSQSTNPLVAEQGRIALAKMDAAAARARGDG